MPKVSVLAVFLFLVSACASIGLAPPSTFEERLAYAVSQNAAVRTAAANSLEAGEISVDDARRVLKITDEIRTALDAANLAANTGDISSAEGRLQLATALLIEIQKYLRAQS